MIVQHGVCSPIGWSPEGHGPNCTFVGDHAWMQQTHIAARAPSIIMGACARNVRSALEKHTRPWAEKVLDLTGGGMLIFEDEQRAGDPDGSRKYMMEWASVDKRVRLILAQQLLYPKWSRTQRLALCRNMLAREAAYHLPTSGMFISFDVDCEFPSPAAMLQLLLDGVRLQAKREFDEQRAITARPARHAWSTWDVVTVNSVLEVKCGRPVLVQYPKRNIRVLANGSVS
ncbi:hypothetical protein AB1Y20_001289 [Prymnesium parvum]|uniref:Uncharacterized protein n=1 Tax=Prymnesium parvum TaxID=97485 RepID=A0AB34KAM4_PRYPA